MRGNNAKAIIILAVLAVVVFGVTFAIINATSSQDDDTGGMSYEKAVESVEKLYKKIHVNELSTVKENVDLEVTDLGDTLPEITKYPAQVEAVTDNYIEIFASTEKATVTGQAGDNDRWLVDVAEAFNKAGYTVDGEPVSVRIRGIASGLGMDYISSGKYVPDAYSPSNELWGDCLTQKGVQLEKKTSRLAGNVAGIVLSKAKYNELLEKYGEITIKTVTEAVANNELAMGYTNPFASSTGANFLLSMLYTFDKNDPLGNTAVSEFEKFQENVPYVAYTTLQMKESAKSGSLDGFVFEYQQFVNTADLKNEYVFTPFGVRHDSPLYAIGNLSDTKSQILDLFIKYCESSENQELAKKYGFNYYDDYEMDISEVNGDYLTSAQKFWKEKKSGNKEIMAVFVADISGSMDGEPLNMLKKSLLTGSKSIGKDCSVGLVTFSNDVNIALPIAKFDLNQQAMFTGAVNNMYAGGGTALFDAIVVAEKMLLDVSADNPNAKTMIFVLSDGEPNGGLKYKAVKDTIQGLQVPVYTIGYNANLDILSEISALNEAASINAETDDVVYKLQSLFNAEM